MGSAPAAVAFVVGISCTVLALVHGRCRTLKTVDDVQRLRRQVSRW